VLRDFSYTFFVVLAARRHKMLEAIEREFEAAHAGFEQLKTDDSAQGLDDEQCN
jgi:NADP-dependent 3-hydroxy acid dehydrogenase YdfG